MEFREDLSSQVPALQMLISMGYDYLSPTDALRMRSGSSSKVLLEGVLKEQLRKINGITFKGQDYEFSEANIHKAINTLTSFRFDGLVKTNEKIYDLLTLGKSLEQTIEGYTKSFTLQYVDWRHPENNVYHVTDEFEVAKVRSHQTRRPDIVVFVNGIPLAVIECKRPDMKEPLDEAISQHLRNQRNDEIPHLFVFSQLLLAVCQNDAMYATCGTARKFWSIWKEDLRGNNEQYFIEQLGRLANQPLTEKQKDRICREKPESVSYFDGGNRGQSRTLTSHAQSEVLIPTPNFNRTPSPQDKVIYALLTPRRLLDMTYRYIVFDSNIKKIARYQQYFAIEEAMRRISGIKGDRPRKGGVIWHTTGSGKSLTMVMLAKAIALDESVRNPRIVLVTDRIDLDDQIWRTFKACGVEVKRARTGEHLIRLVEEDKARVITTVIDKFDTATKKRKVKDESCNIFVLVDESHRSQYGQANAKMQTVFPNACYIGFTGTPLLKDEKNTARRFGGFIHKYSMDQAVKDKAVAPLLYEGRMSELRGNKEAIDKWFDRITSGLTAEQKADLKRKFSREEEFTKSEERMAEIAYDVSSHFSEVFKNTGFKGQFACSGKKVALQYKKLFDDYDMVNTEIIMSAPDTRKDNLTIEEEDTPEVTRFWDAMMKKYGNEKKYLGAIIGKFKGPDDPEILIVIDKLLTGFDAPRNAVLYIDKRLKDHNILQAIARVNRLYDGKDFGLIVDYRGIFGELNAAREAYSALEEFDPEDIEGTFRDIDEEIAKLPERHTNLWAVFKEVENKGDIEAMQQHLAAEDVRQEFYDTLNAYARNLKIALSSAKFWDRTPEKQIGRYNGDLRDFLNLRTAIKQRYAETIDYKEYEAQITNMVKKYIGAGQVKTIIEQVPIFEIEDFDREIAKIEGTAAKADAMASRTKKTCYEKMDEDPSFYKRLSALIDEAIEEYRARRISEKEYLERVMKHMQEARGEGGREQPEILAGYKHAPAFFGSANENISKYEGQSSRDIRDVSAEIAIKTEEIIERRKVRDWQQNIDVQNAIMNELEDYLIKLEGKYQIKLTFNDLDRLLEELMQIAKRRYQ
ncbi:MAG: type I restriction endonuclease subunit R [Syntrophaceae bacterium]|nr:type I restriction endonuclease subunit R [Syntrophaceae bacterium]